MSRFAPLVLVFAIVLVGSHFGKVNTYQDLVRVDLLAIGFTEEPFTVYVTIDLTKEAGLLIYLFLAEIEGILPYEFGELTENDIEVVYIPDDGGQGILINDLADVPLGELANQHDISDDRILQFHVFLKGEGPHHGHQPEPYPFQHEPEQFPIRHEQYPFPHQPEQYPFPQQHQPYPFPQRPHMHGQHQPSRFPYPGRFQ